MGAGAGESDAASRQSRLEFIATLEDDFHTERAVQTLFALAARARNESSKAAVELLCELAGTLGLRLDAQKRAASQHAVDSIGV